MKALKLIFALIAVFGIAGCPDKGTDSGDSAAATGS